MTSFLYLSFFRFIPSSAKRHCPGWFNLTCVRGKKRSILVTPIHRKSGGGARFLSWLVNEEPCLTVSNFRLAHLLAKPSPPHYLLKLREREISRSALLPSLGMNPSWSASTLNIPPPDEEIDFAAISGSAVASHRNLWTVRNWSDALAQHGYSSDDVIPRRDAVVILSRVLKSMARKKTRFVESGEYDRIQDLANVEAQLKERVRSIQLEELQHEFKEQDKLYTHAKDGEMAATTRSLQEKRTALEETVANLLESTAEKHAIERANLELELQQQPKPHMKYSKHVLDLIIAEKGLARLHQFGEARAVRAQLDKLRPQEEAKFHKDFYGSQDQRRAQLAQRHAYEKKKVEERVCNIKLAGLRARKQEKQTNLQRLQIIEQDMHHMHRVTLNRVPELGEEPSAAWQRRRHYSSTASARRGSQLDDRLKGRTAGDGRIAVASLTAIHEFPRCEQEQLSGTMTLHSRPVKLETAAT
jgi:hypothetical protein